jgi:RimJ/RimL family protein N-acetyltransferase
MPNDFGFYSQLISSRDLARLAGFNAANDEFEAQFMFSTALRNQQTLVITNGGVDVGSVLLAPYHTETDEVIENEYEIGYMILPEFWNLGIMGKAFPTIVADLFLTENVQSLHASAMADNVASWHLLRKNGFTEKHTIQHADNDWIAPGQTETFYQLAVNEYRNHTN